MDIFTIVLYALGAIVFVCGIVSILGHLRYQERSQRLPEACKYDDLAQRNEGLRADNAKLEKENDELATVHKDAMEKKKWYEANRDLVLSLEEDRKKQEEIKASYEGYLDKLSGLIPEVQEKSKENEKLSGQILSAQETLQKKTNSIKELDERLAGMRTEKAELEARNASLIKENETQVIENETAVRKLRELQDSVGAEADKLANITAEFMEKNKEYEALDGKLRTTQETLQEKNTTIKELDERLTGMRTERAELEARNASLMKENETQVIENETAVRKLRELQDSVGAEADKLANITAEYTEKKMELDSYQTTKEALLKEIDILRDTIDAIKKETGNQTVTNEEVLKDLWEPIVFPRLSPPKKVKSELDLLANTKEYIRGKKLYFPDRVIHAFHTSLKCNDISPITVLAGISGTGKSELPKCYAEGMGIHFSMLAVQPRWDSPQDLLGFYNYMENKYKATELARALVRFDRYNRDNWGDIPKACDNRSDRMLLVLLDEMNLARVEYYFSEFLSKLETRRGVDPDDEKDRVKAEIELELTGRAPLRIYADRNILFTGTMNEDESTQTLSDKVLDRANVLRFGKPKSTNIAEKVRNSNPRSPRSEGLTYECWHEWCVDAKDVKMDEQVSEWINRLNNAMEELQKPFGHRVAQAIVAYIENYPKGVANGKEKELAFADQIEQRIMPKLRGIDLELNEEPLKKIGELIEETGDKTLYDAYRKGSSLDNNNGVFLWQGIDRSEDF
jgi:methyl coenzyme M reductase subunit D